VPELPEVETTARGLRARIVGRQIVGVANLDWPAMAPNATADVLGQVLVGTTVETVERRGKYVIVGVTGGASLLFHRKMTGNLVIRAGDAPAVPHTHLTISFDDGGRLDFVDPRKFGRIYLFLDEAARDTFLAERLGPEPLEIEHAELARLLTARRGRLKSLLLDQRFLAGIGNLYADEILWEAQLHPERAADSLTSAEMARLHAAIQSILALAYGRTGLPCTRPDCGRPIVRLLIAQRGTWLCLRCQRL
jgi:formamidopyrimidine-DNA glycosylase